MKNLIFTDKILPLGKKTYIMGILNVTPDSFSDGGRYADVKSALLHTEEMIGEGADIIDIGAVSTRPFSDFVGEKEEWERLKDVIPEIRKRYDTVISVDTFNPSTAERALAAGADIINDVSGIFLTEMAEKIKKYNAGWILMHGGVKLRRAEEEISFPDGITEDVNSFFRQMAESIRGFGISTDSIIFDPGFGFSKTNGQNRELLKNFGLLDRSMAPLLCALSKKRFVTSGISSENESMDATVAANISAVLSGADFIRVHDVGIHKSHIAAADRLFR